MIVSAKPSDGIPRSYVILALSYPGPQPPALPRTAAALGKLTAEFDAGRLERHLAELDPSAPAHELNDPLHDWLLDMARTGQLVLLYLAGHGQVDGTDHYLVTAHTGTRALRARTAISASELAKVVAHSPAGQVLIVIDACQSGSASSTMTATIDAINANRSPGSGPAVGLIVSAHPRGTAKDGNFAEALYTVLSDSDRWSEKDEYLETFLVARALRQLLGPSVVDRIDSAVERILPNLAFQRTPDVDLETKKRLGEHFFRSASSLEITETGWYFTGRQEILRRVAEWLRDRDQGMLVVTGAPGTGKSAIMGRIWILADPTGAAFVAEHDPAFSPTDDTNPPTGSISVAIHARGKSTGTIVAEIAAGLGIQVNPGGDPSLELLTVVRASGIPGTILIDALDEATGFAAVEIADLLRRLVAEPAIRVLVGTRPDRSAIYGGAEKHGIGEEGDRQRGALLRVLGADPAAVIDLGTDPDNTRRDLTAYVFRRITEPGCAWASAGDHAAAAAVAGWIAERAEPVFLYARLATKALLNRSDPIDLTPGWQHRVSVVADSDDFARAVAADLDRHPAEFAGRLRGMLRGLAWGAGNGLPRRLWPVVSSAVGAEEYRDTDVEATMVAAPWYIVEGSEAGQTVYRLYHEELGRYFRKPLISDDLTRGPTEVDIDGPQPPADGGLDPRSSGVEIHARITDALMALVGTGGARWYSSDPYLRRHLASHARIAGTLASLVADAAFVIAAEPSDLLPGLGLPELLSGPNGELSLLYRHVAHELTGQPLAQRAAILGLASQAEGAASQQLAEMNPPMPWRCRWARGLSATLHRTLTGHDGPIHAVAFGAGAADQSLLASASDDATVRVWDPESGETRHVLTGHDGWVRDVAFGGGPGNQPLLASAGDDGTVRLWDPDSGALWRVLTGHAGPVRAVAFGAGAVDEPLLASAGDDGIVRVWEPHTGTVRHSLTGHEGWVFGVAFGADAGGRPLLASAGDDGTVRIWDLDSGAARHILTGHEGWVLALDYGTDAAGRPLLASAGDDGTVRVWDPDSGETRQILTDHAGWVQAVAFGTGAARRPLLASASRDGTVRVWDPDTSEPRQVLTGHEGWVLGVGFGVGAAGQTLLASGGDDGTVRVWDPDRVETRPVLTGHAGWAQAVALGTGAVGQPLLASGGDDGTVRVWDPDSGETRQILIGHRGWVEAVAFGTGAAHQSLLASASRDRTVRVWDPDSGETRQILTGHAGMVFAVAFGTDSAGQPLLASAGRDGTVRIWDPDNGETRQILTGHHVAVTAVAFGFAGPGEPLLASAGDDGIVRVWDPESSEALRSLAGHNGRVTAVALGAGAGGRPLMASASRDRTVRIWDPVLGDEITRIPTLAGSSAVALDQKGLVAIGTRRHLLVIDTMQDLTDVSSVRSRRRRASRSKR